MRAADPSDAAQVQLSAGRAADPGNGCRALCRRAGRSRRRGDQRRGRGHCRRRADRDRRIAGGGRRPRCAQARRAARSCQDTVEHRRRRPLQDRRLRRNLRQGAPARAGRDPLAAAECDAARGARGARGLRCSVGPRDADLHDTDAASPAHRGRRYLAVSGIRSARRGARCRRRVRAENVAAGGIRGAGLAGAAVARHSGVDGRPARKSDRRISQPRSACRARGRVRRTRQADCAYGRRRRKCRRLFLLSDHLRRRTSDGYGRIARPLRCPRLFVRGARCRDAYLHDGALSWRVAPGHHACDRAADGQGGGGICDCPR